MNQYKTLFEQQSYRDALEYYLASLDNQALAVWDYVILTASNDDQAKAYQVQISTDLKISKFQIELTMRWFRT